MQNFLGATGVMAGIGRCGRYSFGPNRLHYCGPDANTELRDLINDGKDNFGLEIILKQFKTLFPYLKYIATENKIKDPFDDRVVEAYWLGNSLLEKIEQRNWYDFLVDGLRVRDKVGNKEFAWLAKKIELGALPHHSFHVLNIWQQKGLDDRLEDLDRLNECRISSGKVVKVDGHQITVNTDKLALKEGKIFLQPNISRTLTRQLESEYDIEQVKPGQIVSIHWGVPCEVITEKQESILRKYNLKSIKFANMTA